MTATSTVESLEQALFERAKKLADEYLLRARQTRERMIDEENERLRIREEREVLAAEVAAERSYHRQIQAVQVQLQGELDRHRWLLMDEVKTAITSRFQSFAATDDYIPVLGGLLSQAAHALGNDEKIIAQLNATDLARLNDRWSAFVADTVGGLQVDLDPNPGVFAGGVRVRNAADTVRVDNTLEGRMSRLEDQLNEAIATTLFTGKGYLHD